MVLSMSKTKQSSFNSYKEQKIEKGVHQEVLKLLLRWLELIILWNRAFPFEVVCICLWLQKTQHDLNWLHVWNCFKLIMQMAKDEFMAWNASIIVNKNGKPKHKTSTHSSNKTQLQTLSIAWWGSRTCSISDKICNQIRPQRILFWNLTILDSKYNYLHCYLHWQHWTTSGVVDKQVKTTGFSSSLQHEKYVKMHNKPPFT